jgi:hypothetical protein
MTRNRVEAPLEVDPNALCLQGVVPLNLATIIISRKEIKKAMENDCRICSALPKN